MNLDELLQIIKGELPFLKQKFGIAQIGVFGSYARNDQSEQSDVDILVEFDCPVGLEFVSLKLHLEGVLSKKVDLVTPAMLKPGVKDDIIREIIWISPIINCMKGGYPLEVKPLHECMRLHLLVNKVERAASYVTDADVILKGDNPEYDKAANLLDKTADYLEKTIELIQGAASFIREENQRREELYKKLEEAEQQIADGLPLLDIEEVINKLDIKYALPAIFKEYPIQSVSMLEMDDEINLFIDFNQPSVSLLVLTQIKHRVEEIINKTVNVIHAPVVDDCLIDSSQAIKIYEREK